MITKSIYRAGGSLDWASTVGQIKDAFKHAKPSITVRITAGDKGWGKSTVFECLADCAPGIAIEGDIMSVLAYCVIGDAKLEDSMKMDEIAKGTAIPGFMPWGLKIDEARKDELFHQALTSILGSGWNDKISLTTGFRGLDPDVTLRVVPDFGFYKKNLEARTAAMLKSDRSSDEFKEHIKTSHKVLSWTEFSQKVREQIESASKDKVSFWIPNLDENLDVAALTALQIAVEYAETCVLESPIKGSDWKFNKQLKTKKDE